jgi:hypothetical protein
MKRIGALALVGTLVAGCSASTNTKPAFQGASSAAPATATAPRASTWHPADWDLWPGDQSVAFDWNPNPTCDSSADDCFQMEVVTRDGCDDLYVELALLDDSQTNIGMSNDTASGLGAGERAKLTFPVVEEGVASARVVKMQCA